MKDGRSVAVSVLGSEISEGTMSHRGKAMSKGVDHLGIDLCDWVGNTSLIASLEAEKYWSRF